MCLPARAAAIATSLCKKLGDDVDYIDGGILYHVLPGRGRALVTELARSSGRELIGGVDQDDQPDLDRHLSVHRPWLRQAMVCALAIRPLPMIPTPSVRLPDALALMGRTSFCPHLHASHLSLAGQSIHMVAYRPRQSSRAFSAGTHEDQRPTRVGTEGDGMENPGAG